MSTGEFSVYWWDAEDGQHEELRFVDASIAMKRAYTLTHGPASMLGMVKRVIITDGGDCINFEWKKGSGITYPTEYSEISAEAIKDWMTL